MLNTAAYIIYLFVTYLITVHVGYRFYKHGRIFILTLLHGNEKITHAINRLLLVGYYLLNLGYASLMLRSWTTISNLATLVSSIGSKTGTILITLAILHYGNMLAIGLLAKKNKSLLITQKNNSYGTV